MNKVKEAVHKVEAKVHPGGGNQNKGLILVTGATSFIGTHVIRVFLEAGYTVRGQVRNEASAAKVHKVFPGVETSRLTTVVVPDITVPGAFDAAVAAEDGPEGSTTPVTGVIHTASPFVFAVKDNEKDLLDPAIKGTTRVLEAVAAHAPHVRRVVVTSSFAAILDPAQGARPGYTYTEADWNPTAYETAKNTADGGLAYCASKTFAERAAWDYVAQHQPKPNFTVATVNPPMVYGPVEHDTTLTSLNTSIADIYRFMDGSQTEPGPTAFPVFADVRDVAEAHLRAFERDQPGRYFITSGTFEYRDVCRVLRDVLPDRRDKIPDPEATPSAAGTFWNVDNSQTARDLGMTFTSLHDSIRDTALSLVALEQGKTWKEVSKK